MSNEKKIKDSTDYMLENNELRAENEKMEAQMMQMEKTIKELKAQIEKKEATISMQRNEKKKIKEVVKKAYAEYTTVGFIHGAGAKDRGNAILENLLKDFFGEK